MASISSVITGGFGPPGSAALVITDGYGTAAAATELRGRPRRRRWRASALVMQDPTPALVRQERELVNELLAAVEADVADYVAEANILRGALDAANSRRTAASIQALLDRVERRIADAIEDDDVISLLI